jgi:hypothetical protein
MAKSIRGQGLSGSNIGSEYDKDEDEALKSADAFRVKHGLSFLSLTQFLQVLKDIGWRKVTGPHVDAKRKRGKARK